jgi:hypothetical protein
LAGIALVLALVFVGGAYLLPSTAGAERSIVVAATPEDVYARLIDLKKFNEWSPWAKLDPEAKYSFEGSPEGPGQIMKWSSAHPQVGSGSQEIMEATPHEQIEIALDFGERGNGRSWYKLTPEGAGTRVSWGFTTELGNDPVMRWMGLKVGDWIAADFDKGLSALKNAVEKETGSQP